MMRLLIARLLLLFICQGTHGSEAHGNTPEQDFVVEASKEGVELLAPLKDYTPGPAALVGSALYFANCSKPDLCESVHRFSDKDTQIEKIAGDLNVRDLYEYGGKLVVERVVPTAEKPVAGEGGIQIEVLKEDGTFGLLWGDQMKRAEATARFALHSLLKDFPTLDRKLYSRAFNRRSLVQDSEAADNGIMLFQVANSGGPLVLGQLKFEKESEVTTQVIAPEQLAMTLTQVQALSSNRALALAPSENVAANELQSVIAQFDLKSGTIEQLGRVALTQDLAVDHVPKNQWAARTISRITPTPEGGALVADETSEPGEKRSLWYLPPQGTDFFRVLGIPSADIRYAKLTREGLLVSHGLGRSIVLYRKKAEKDSTSLSALRENLKKAKASLKTMERGTGCARYYLVSRGPDLTEIIFRKDTTSGIQDFVSLGTFKTRADMQAPVRCMPNESIALLASQGTLNLAIDHLSLRLEWGERRRSNYKALFALSERKGNYRVEGGLGRLPSAEAVFKSETPVLLVFKGSTLSLARESLLGSQFHDILQAKEPVGAKTIRLVSSDGQALTEYELMLMPDGTEVFATDYSADPAKPALQETEK